MQKYKKHSKKFSKLSNTVNINESFRVNIQMSKVQFQSIFNWNRCRFKSFFFKKDYWRRENTSQKAVVDRNDRWKTFYNRSASDKRDVRRRLSGAGTKRLMLPSGLRRAVT